MKLKRLILSGRTLRASWVSAALGLVWLGGCGSAVDDDERDDAEGGTAGSTSDGSSSGGTSRGGDSGSGTSSAGENGGGRSGDDPTHAGGAAEGGAVGNGAGAGGVPVEQPENPDFPPEADRDRDVLETALDVDLTSLRATATVVLAPSESSGASLEGGALRIYSIHHGDTLLAWERADDGWIDIGVPPSTEPLALTFDYEIERRHDHTGVVADGSVFTWSNHCGNVFPCRSHPSDGARFTLNLRESSAFAVISPKEIPSDAPAYMVSWIEGDYHELPLGKTTAGTAVSLWHFGRENTALTRAVGDLRRSFDWFERKLGPYRFGSKVGSVIAPWNSGVSGGMEHHPYWHVSTTDQLDPVIHVHEAAHGWFGNGVRLACWEDIVLSEGTATYLAARALEHSTLVDDVWERYQEKLDSIIPRVNLIPAWSRACEATDGKEVFSPLAYYKGAFFYRAIEERIGRAGIDEVLGTFYERFAGGAAGMQDMLDVIEDVSGYDPTACAQGWLLEVPVPLPAACE